MNQEDGQYVAARVKEIADRAMQSIMEKVSGEKEQRLLMALVGTRLLFGAVKSENVAELVKHLTNNYLALIVPEIDDLH